VLETSRKIIVIISFPSMQCSTNLVCRLGVSAWQSLFFNTAFPASCDSVCLAIIYEQQVVKQKD